MSHSSYEFTYIDDYVEVDIVLEHEDIIKINKELENKSYEEIVCYLENNYYIVASYIYDTYPELICPMGNHR